jgi:hypothetical protein
MTANHTGTPLPHPKIWAKLVEVSAKRKKAKSEEQQFIEHRQFLEKEIVKHEKGTRDRGRLCVEYYDTLEAIKGARVAAKWLADKADKIIDKGIDGKLWEDADDDDGEPVIPDHTGLFDPPKGDDDDEPAAKPVGEPPAAAKARTKPSDLTVDLGQQKPAEPARAPAAAPTRGADSKLLIGTRTIGIDGRPGDALYKAGFGVLATVADFMDAHPGRERQALVDEVMGKAGFTLSKAVLDKLERAILDAKAADACVYTRLDAGADIPKIDPQIMAGPGPIEVSGPGPLDVSLKSFLSEKDEAACRDVGLLTLADFAKALESNERPPVNSDTCHRLAGEINKRTPATKPRKPKTVAAG